MRLAGDIFLGGSRFGAQDSDPDKYTSDDYMRALNKGGSFNLGTKENRNGWARTENVDDGGYGNQMTTQGRERLEADRGNPLYQKVAADLGITNFSSANDMAQVIKHLSDKGGSPGDSDSSKGWRKDLERSDYIDAAKRIGIKSFDSENDLRQVRASLGQ